MNLSEMRNSSIDIIKALSIIAMVIGHYNLSGEVDKFVNLFHMACFLLAAGYFVKYERFSSVQNLLKYLLRRIKRLWWPVVFWSCLFILSHNLFCSIGFYTDNVAVLELGRWNFTVSTMTFSEMRKLIVHAVLLQPASPLTGQLWFIQVLFCVSVLYGVILWVTVKLRVNSFWVQTAVAVIFLVFGRFVPYDWWFLKIIGGGRFFACYGLYHVGYIISKVHYFDRLEQHGRIFSLFVLSVCSFSLALLYYMGFRVGLSHNVYSNALVLLVSALSGWGALACIGRLFPKRIQYWFAYVGEHTMPILILQWFMFRVVNIIGVYFLDKPKYMIAAYPTAFTGLLSGVVYVSVSVIGALLMSHVWWRLYGKLVAMLKGSKVNSVSLVSRAKGECCDVR